MEIPQKLPIFATKLMNSIVMCTYKITVKDTLIDRVRPAFVDNHEIAKWMQQQLEVILLQLAAQMEGKNAERGLSQRLRGIAHAPKDFPFVLFDVFGININNNEAQKGLTHHKSSIVK